MVPIGLPEQHQTHAISWPPNSVCLRCNLRELAETSFLALLRLFDCPAFFFFFMEFREEKCFCKYSCWLCSHFHGKFGEDKVQASKFKARFGSGGFDFRKMSHSISPSISPDDLSTVPGCLNRKKNPTKLCFLYEFSNKEKPRKTLWLDTRSGQLSSNGERASGDP